MIKIKICRNSDQLKSIFSKGLKDKFDNYGSNSFFFNKELVEKDFNLAVEKIYKWAMSYGQLQDLNVANLLSDFSIFGYGNPYCFLRPKSINFNIRSITVCCLSYEIKGYCFPISRNGLSEYNYELLNVVFLDDCPPIFNTSFLANTPLFEYNGKLFFVLTTLPIYDIPLIKYFYQGFQYPPILHDYMKYDFAERINNKVEFAKSGEDEMSFLPIIRYSENNKETLYLPVDEIPK